MIKQTPNRVQPKSMQNEQDLISYEVQEGESGRTQTQSWEGSPQSPVFPPHVPTESLSLSHETVISTWE